MEYAENQSWKLYLASEITKREYFAGLAMQGLLSYSYCNPSTGNYHENSTAEGVAKKSIEYADALLTELEKE